MGKVGNNAPYPTGPMPIPAPTPTNPNPTKSVVGPTWAGGNSNSIRRLQLQNQRGNPQQNLFGTGGYGGYGGYGTGGYGGYGSRTGQNPITSGAQQNFNGPKNNHGNDVIGGYENSGIQTDRFQQQYGRAPTAGDYEKTFGGLSPSHDQMGSLDDFYARKTTDPNTGLSIMPSSWDKMQQQSMLQKKGDFAGSQAIKNYYNNGGAYNPQAGAQLENYKANRQQLQALNGSSGPFNNAGGLNSGGAYFDHSTPASGVQNVPLGNPGSDPSQWTGAPVDTGVFQPSAAPTIMGKAKGGPTQVHPYMVGEKGDELWTGKDGKQEILGADGPEIRTFDEPGYVTPHNKLPDSMKIPHREMGGWTGGSIGSEIAPFVGSGRTPSGLPLFGRGNSSASIFASGYNPSTGSVPTSPTMSFLAKGGHAMASPRMQLQHRYVGGNTQGSPEAMTADNGGGGTMDAMPQFPMPLSIPHYNPANNNVFFNAFTRQPVPDAPPSEPTPVPQNNQPMIDRVMSNRGADLITPQGSKNPEFLTPYGFLGGTPSSSAGAHVMLGGQPWVNPEKQSNYLPPPTFHNFDEWQQQQNDAHHQNVVAANDTRVNSANTADKAAGVNLKGVDYKHRAMGGATDESRISNAASRAQKFQKLARAIK